MTLEMAGEVPQYQPLHLFVRPARVAVLVRDGEDWMPGVLRTIEGFSRIWGGVADIVVPVLPGGVLPECFWPVLVRFDPDHLGCYQPTRRGWQMADPAGFDTWLTSQAQQWVARNGGTLDEARRLLTEDHMMHGPADDFTLPDTLQARLRTQLAPLAPGGDLVEASFLADQPPGPRLVDLLGLDANPPRLQILRAEDLDPRVRLMIAARTGALSPSHAAALTDRGVVIDEVGIAKIDLSLILELCWRRRMRPGGLALRRAFAAAQGQEPGAPAARTGEDFLQRTPFGDTMRGCGWFLPIGWELRPFFVVCGDSAADFCLALALDRCYGDAAWFPHSFVHGDDDVAATARFTLALLIDGLRSAAETRPSVVTSATLTDAEVMKAAQALLPEAVGEDRVSVAEPARLPLGRPWRLFDREQFDRSSRQPFVASELAGELPLLRPSVARARNVWACTWQVDVAVEGYQLPPRWAVNRRLTPEQHLWTWLRSGTDGISYFSHSMGLVSGSASLEQALARPRLRLPDAREVFDALLAQAGLRSEDSAVGRYSQIVLDLWGGLEALAADLRPSPASNLLHAYLRPRPKKGNNGQPGIFLESQRRWFLSLEEAAPLSGTGGQETRVLLDALVSRGVLRRGLILQCGRCSYAGWYRLEELGQMFTCGRCQRASLIVQEAWKQPHDGEPYWYYDLDEVVYQALDHDIRVPILALSQLAEGARSVLIRPEADVWKDGQWIAEVDLWAIIDGRVVVGEAKTDGRLDPERTKERKAASRLAEVAAAVAADEVILATTASAWNPTTITTMNAALAPHLLPLRVLTGLGA